MKGMANGDSPVVASARMNRNGVDLATYSGTNPIQLAWIGAQDGVLNSRFLAPPDPIRFMRMVNQITLVGHDFRGISMHDLIHRSARGGWG